MRLSTKRSWRPKANGHLNPDSTFSSTAFMMCIWSLGGDSSFILPFFAQWLLWALGACRAHRALLAHLALLAHWALPAPQKPSLGYILKSRAFCASKGDRNSLVLFLWLLLSFSLFICVLDRISLDLEGQQDEGREED